jgi:hypothetical protein
VWCARLGAWMALCTAFDVLSVDVFNSYELEHQSNLMIFKTSPRAVGLTVCAWAPGHFPNDF